VKLDDDNDLMIIDLADDNDEYVDIGCDDDFDHLQIVLLAESIDRSDRRCAERERS
jgi:hypothetical protein